MLSSLPYGSSSLTQDKIPVSISNNDRNRNNAPIYEVSPRYPPDVLAISNTFFFSPWRFCIVFLVLSSDLWHAIRKQKRRLQLMIRSHAVTVWKLLHQNVVLLLVAILIVSWKQGVVTFSGPVNKLAYRSLSTLLVSRCLAVSIILVSEKGDGHISWISRNKSGIGYHQVNMGANEGTVTKIRADEESDKQCSFFVSFWPNNQSRGGGRLVTAFQSERLVFKFTREQVEVLIEWVCQTSTSVKIVIKD